MRIAIINDTRSTHHFGCMLVMENLCQLLRGEGVEIVWTWPVSVDWRKSKKKIVSMPPVDAIIINGEGTIHHNATRRFSQALIEFVEFSVKSLNLPCYLINATLHNNNSEAYKKLSLARAIYVRDKGSLLEVSKAGLQAQYVPDMTFAENRQLPASSGSGVCVIDSAVKEDAVRLKVFALSHEFPFRSMVVARPSNARFLRSPRPWVKNIYRWLKEERLMSTSPAAYIDYLREFGLVVTGRYHTVTMCMKNQIPFIALESNTPKVRYLLEDAIGDTSRSIPVEQLNNIDLNDYSQLSVAEVDALSRFTSEAELKTREMIRSIVRDLDNGLVGLFGYS